MSRLNDQDHRAFVMRRFRPRNVRPISTADRGRRDEIRSLMHKALLPVSNVIVGAVVKNAPRAALVGTAAASARLDAALMAMSKTRTVKLLRDRYKPLIADGVGDVDFVISTRQSTFEEDERDCDAVVMRICNTLNRSASVFRDASATVGADVNSSPRGVSVYFTDGDNAMCFNVDNLLRDVRGPRQFLVRGAAFPTKHVINEFVLYRISMCVRFPKSNEPERFYKCSLADLVLREQSVSSSEMAIYGLRVPVLTSRVLIREFERCVDGTYECSQEPEKRRRREQFARALQAVINVGVSV